MWSSPMVLVLGLFLAMTASMPVARAETVVLEVTRAAAGFDERTGKPVVTYHFANKRAFADLTEKNVGKRLELRIGGRVILSTIVREPILGGAGQVSGNFTVEQTKEIADLLLSSAKIEAEIKLD
jgi:preprotein translocase subunit SecD